MATAAVSPPPPKPEPPTPPDHLPRPSVAISWDSEALCKRAETCELESEAFLIDPALLPTLEGLLLELYAMLRPKPVDYEQRHTMINVFNKIAKDIFGTVNEFPVVEPFGSFTMDLFTAESDLDLSVNFSSDMHGQFARKEKISAIKKFAKVLYKHQRRGLCHGVLPVVSAKVPVLKVTDKGTGVECDISVENKDGMSRSMIFKLVSSIDERFQILCFLMKFWAKKHDVNCPKEGTMSSMAIISLVAFHLQTRHPPILPAFSGLLKDGADFASIQKNVLLFEGFGSNNKESVAELFVSLMSKLLAVEGLWEQGLCASNFDGFWISKTWGRGIGILSVEDFLDRSQNFARAVGKDEMQIICGCLRDSVSKLADFFKGNIDALTLKILIFGALPVSHPSPKPGGALSQDVAVSHLSFFLNSSDPSPKPGGALSQDVAVSHPSPKPGGALSQDVPVRHSSPKPGKSKRKRESRHAKQQKKGKHTAQLVRAANMAVPILPTPVVVMPVSHPSPKPGGALSQDVPVRHSSPKPGGALSKDVAVSHPSPKPDGALSQDVPVSHPSPKPDGALSQDVAVSHPSPKPGGPLNQDVAVSHPSPQPGKSKRKRESRHAKQQKKGKHTAQLVRAANMAVPILPTPIVFMPPPPVHHIYQFGPVPQHHLMHPPRFAYGSHSHPAPHMIGQPQGSFIPLNPGVQLQQQAQHMFGSLLAHQRAIDGSFHPYGAQRIHYDENGPLPYGINPNYRRI